MYTSAKNDSIEEAASKLVEKIYKRYTQGPKKGETPGIRLPPEKMELNNKMYRENIYQAFGSEVKDKCCKIM